MGACMVIYVVGIPLGSYLILRANRRLIHPLCENPEALREVHDHHLHDATVREVTCPYCAEIRSEMLKRGQEYKPASQEERERAAVFATVYGQLFLAYEPLSWYPYFESVIMVNKALLTGGLVLVAPGTSAQIMTGLVVALAFAFILLEAKPYQDAVEDKMQTITSICTVLTLLIGFALKVDRTADGESDTYNHGIMDVILVTLFALVIGCACYLIWKAVPQLNCKKHIRAHKLRQQQKLRRQKTKKLAKEAGSAAEAAETAEKPAVASRRPVPLVPTN